MLAIQSCLSLLHMSCIRLLNHCTSALVLSLWCRLVCRACMRASSPSSAFILSLLRPCARCTVHIACQPKKNCVQADECFTLQGLSLVRTCSLCTVQICSKFVQSDKAFTLQGLEPVFAHVACAEESLRHQTKHVHCNAFILSRTRRLCTPHAELETRIAVRYSLHIARPLDPALCKAFSLSLLPFATMPAFATSEQYHIACQSQQSSCSQIKPVRCKGFILLVLHTHSF